LIINTLLLTLIQLIVHSSSRRPSTSTDNALRRDWHSSSIDFSFALIFAHTLYTNNYGKAISYAGLQKHLVKNC